MIVENPKGYSDPPPKFLRPSPPHMAGEVTGRLLRRAPAVGENVMPQENDSNYGTLLPPIAYSKLAVREIAGIVSKLLAFSGPPLQCSRDRPSSVCFRHGHPMRLDTTGDSLSRRLPSPRALIDSFCWGRRGNQAVPARATRCQPMHQR